jgi:hypothetical protein
VNAADPADGAGQWPTVTEYMLAMQHPGTAFGDPLLRATAVDVGGDGQPDTVQGQNAVVFFGQHEGSPIVIRCLKRPPRPGSAERWTALHSHLTTHPVPAFVPTVWIDRGLFVADHWRPVVRMDDVGGTSLRSYVERHREHPAALRTLAEGWTAVLADMSRQRVAHGDLQQDNIRVTDDGRIRLIDYDGVWAPPIAHLPPAEIGHPNFQHPGRSLAHWGPTVDLFSAVVVQLSLLAVAEDPQLWTHHNAENLVLTAADYRSPMGTGTWHRMAGSRDPQVRELVAVLNQLCHLPAGLELDPAAVVRERRLGEHRLPDIVAAPSATAWWAPDQGSRPGAPSPGTPSTGPAPVPAAWSVPAAEPVVAAAQGGPTATFVPPPTAPASPGAPSPVQPPWVGGPPAPARSRTGVVVLALVLTAFLLVLFLLAVSR